MDGVIGLSAGTAAGYADLAVIARFNPNGQIDARNGAAYQALTSIPYTVGTSYRFRLVINVPGHTYDIYVTPANGVEQVVGRAFAFRSEQATVTSLSNWALYAQTGTHQVCNFALASAPPPAATPTATRTPTATAARNLAAIQTRIREVTFEDGSLIHPSSGVDNIGGTVALETTAPVKGSYSARIHDPASDGYIDVEFAAVDDLYASFNLRINVLPSVDSRIALISNGGTTVGNLILRSNGALFLRHGSSTVGSESAPLRAGSIYRVGLRQAKGNGTDAVLEGYVTEGDAAVGAPFAVMANGPWTTSADRLRIGVTGSVIVDAVVDDIKLDTASMPGD